MTEVNTNSSKKGLILWPESDVATLLQHIKEQIPKEDRLSYKSRMRKLDWEKIAFGNYGVDECKSTWIKICQKLRGFRLLQEVVGDAEEWLTRPWISFQKKNEVHPDKPKRPSNSLQVYIHEMQPLRNNFPEFSQQEFFSYIISKYRNLSPEEKETYIKKSRLQKKEYLRKLRDFLKAHPSEVSKNELKLLNQENIQDSGLKLYLDENIKLKSETSTKSLEQLMTKYTKKWDKLSEEERLVWSQQAKELSKPKKKKKESQKYLSFYNFFFKKMMNDKKISGLPSAERMKAVSELWKKISEEEKQILKEEYSKIPQPAPQSAKRKTEKEATKPRKKLKTNNIEQPDDKIKSDDIVDAKETTQKRFPGEPKPPPEEPIMLFKKDMKKKKIKYENSEELTEAWSSLSKIERKEYKKKWKQMNLEYLTDYETFTSSLSKKDFKAYRKFKLAQETG